MHLNQRLISIQKWYDTRNIQLIKGRWGSRSNRPNLAVANIFSIFELKINLELFCVVVGLNFGVGLLRSEPSYSSRLNSHPAYVPTLKSSKLTTLES